MLRRLATTSLVPLLLLSLAPARANGESNNVQVEPDNIQIGISYSGQTIRVKASSPAPEGIVMRVTGPEEPLVLMKKGKRYGFLWMNVGEVRYEAVPTLYLLRSSRKLHQMATPETLSRLELGFDALKDRVPVGSEDGARELFGELLKLKQKDHLFCSEAAGVQLDLVGDGRQEATGAFLLPAKALVGDYTVDVFGFREGEGELIGTAKIHVQRSSGVSFITSLVTNHGFLYGCLAVAVAILAGLSTGYIFGMGKGRSH
jgi:uncharacterized protein (TIGR02186 family)